MPVAARLSAGSVFAGDYRIVDMLAEGGMGTLYRAEQLSTRKLRALKLVHARLASDPKSRARFVREATVGASIESEHIVEVIAAGIDESTDQPWLAMELLEGGDLGSLVEHAGPLSPEQLMVVMQQLCYGLAAAHRSGVVHRDLKPANIFVARSRRAGTPFTVKILDFGIAKVVEAGKSGATETETVGSPMWMAPEQLNAQRPTPATDVWALGLIAFWALTGKHYWRAAHVEHSRVQALFVEQLFKEMHPPSQRAAEYGVGDAIPPGFDAWFAGCLEREGSDRIADAATALARLREATGLAIDPSRVAPLLPEGPLPASSSSARVAAQGPTLASEATDTDPDARPASAAMQPTIAGGEPLGADLSEANLDPPPPPPTPAPVARRAPVVLATALGIAAVLVGAAWWAVTGGPLARSTLPMPSVQIAQVESPSPDATDLRPPQPITRLDPIPEHVERTGPQIELVVPQPHQPSFAAAQLRFLGWSSDSRRFVLRATHRNASDDDPLDLVQLHDALTGAMIESYTTQRSGRIRSRHRGDLRRLAAQAGAAAEFAARREALALVATEATRTLPEGDRLELETDEPPPGTTFVTKDTAGGFAFQWAGLSSPPPEGEAKRRGPFMRTVLVHDDERWPLLQIRPPFRYDEVAARATTEPARVTGRLEYYPSPDGRRVVILASGRIQPKVSDDRQLSARWFLRALGPQIRVVEAGAGQQVAREVARRLEAAGLPTAAVSLREPLAAHSEIYYRASWDGAEALAETIRGELTRNLSIEAVTDDGWTTVVVVLGQDLAP